MNVLISAVSSATGPSGICRHAYSLACCATRRAEVSQVIIVVGKWQVSYFKELFRLDHVKINLVSANVSNTALARNNWYLQKLHALAIAEMADVIHLSFPVPIRRSKLPCPLVVSLHDLYPYDEPKNFGFPRVFFNRTFLHQCLREADAIVCVSETTHSRLGVRFPRIARRKSVVVYNPVNISSTQRIVPTCENRPFFLMISQHRSNKNIPMAIEVFKVLLHRQLINSQTSLLVVGNSGPETGIIESMIKRSGLERAVQLLNGLADDELSWL